MQVSALHIGPRLVEHSFDGDVVGLVNRLANFDGGSAQTALDGVLVESENDAHSLAEKEGEYSERHAERGGA